MEFSYQPEIDILLLILWVSKIVAWHKWQSRSNHAISGSSPTSLQMGTVNDITYYCVFRLRHETEL